MNKDNPVHNKKSSTSDLSLATNSTMMSSDTEKKKDYGAFGRTDTPVYSLHGASGKPRTVSDHPTWFHVYINCMVIDLIPFIHAES
jgi:hypothetical protein